MRVRKSLRTRLRSVQVIARSSQGRSAPAAAAVQRGQLGAAAGESGFGTRATTTTRLSRLQAET